jgi:hypothetical protein
VCGLVRARWGNQARACMHAAGDGGSGRGGRRVGAVLVLASTALSVRRRRRVLHPHIQDRHASRMLRKPSIGSASAMACDRACGACPCMASRPTYSRLSVSPSPPAADELSLLMTSPASATHWLLHVAYLQRRPRQVFPLPHVAAALILDLRHARLRFLHACAAAPCERLSPVVASRPLTRMRCGRPFNRYRPRGPATYATSSLVYQSPGQ